MTLIIGRVYAIVRNDSTYLYIGSTSRLVRLRVNAHRFDQRRKNSRLYRYLRQHGFDNFQFEIIDVLVCTRYELRTAEDKYIRIFNPCLNSIRACTTNLADVENGRPRNRDRCNTYYRTHRKVILDRNRALREKYVEFKRRNNYLSFAQFVKSCHIGKNNAERVDQLPIPIPKISSEAIDEASDEKCCGGMAEKEIKKG